jgi:hypothetical protein
MIAKLQAIFAEVGGDLVQGGERDSALLSDSRREMNSEE